MKYLHILRRFLFTFCGYFYPWLVVVNVVGTIYLINVHTPPPCVPYATTFAVFQTPQCESELAEAAWAIFVGIPRLIYVPFHLTILLVRTAHYIHSILEALYWLAFSTPFLLIVVNGFRYWRRRSRIIPWIITLPMVLLIFYTESYSYFHR